MFQCYYSQIIHLLNSCCVHEEHGDQVVSDGSGYLLILPPCALENGNDVPVTWNGKTVVVSPTMDTAISLADIQVRCQPLLFRYPSALQAAMVWITVAHRK